MVSSTGQKFIDLTQENDFKRSIFNAIVAPRPIGWISTVSRAGVANLAPYSYFTLVSVTPPTLAFSCNTPEDRPLKDTLTNVMETGEFVYNLASYDLIAELNATSSPLPYGHDEFGHAGLLKADCVHVRAPRVAAAPVNLECKVVKIVRLADDGPPGDIPFHVTFGRVVGVHVHERYLDANGYFLTELAQPVARLGGAKYAVSDTPFEMTRQFTPAQHHRY